MMDKKCIKEFKELLPASPNKLRLVSGGNGQGFICLSSNCTQVFNCNQGS